MTAPLDMVKWIHGAPDCALSTDPLISNTPIRRRYLHPAAEQVLQLRGQLYLPAVWRHPGLVFDTGGPPNPRDQGEALTIRQTVDGIIDGWVKKHRLDGIDLVVAHTQCHGDHDFWDSQFVGRPRTTVVKPQLSSVKAFFELPDWPNGEATLELGNRGLTIFPIPGHETSHIAVYDPRNKWLLTGDTLYAGLLTIQDWHAYRASAARLAQFAHAHEISYVLGNHIEMKNQPRQLYPIGTTYQPNEHPLPLTAAHNN
jgi:hydroxyacylglutathione hydrolase